MVKDKDSTKNVQISNKTIRIKIQYSDGIQHGILSNTDINDFCDKKIIISTINSQFNFPLSECIFIIK